MRIVLIGSGPFAVPLPRGILRSSHEIVAVVTRPPSRAGRGRRAAPSEVDVEASTAGIGPIFRPERLRDPTFLDGLRDLAAEGGVVADYGKLLPAELIGLFPYGIVGIHPSLLPRYRGAAPIQRALMAGERETGISFFLADARFDAGPVLDRIPERIGEEETTGDLLDRLARAAAGRLPGILDRVGSGRIEPIPQDSSVASPAPRLRPEESRIDWTAPAASVRDRIRGLSPDPAAFTLLPDGRRLKLLRARAEPEAPSPGPGLLTEGRCFRVGAGTGVVDLLEVQPEGKRPMPGDAYLRGVRLDPGACLT